MGTQPAQHDEAQGAAVTKVVARVGAVSTVAIGPHGEVYDGHQRLNALLSAYGADYAIEARQSERELSDDERAALTLAANLPAGAWDWDKLAHWDAAALGEWGMDAEQLSAWNNDAANLATMLEVPPDFSPVSVDEQGRLDQKSPTCPLCGGEFVPL